MGDARVIQRRSLIRAATIVATVALAVGGWRARATWLERQATEAEQACALAEQSADWSRLEQLARAWRDWAPQEPVAALYLATALERQGRAAEAAEALQSVRLNGSQDIEAHERLAKLQFGPLDQPLEGLETCEQLLAMDPKNAAARGYKIHFFAMTLQRMRLIEAVREAIDLRVEQPEHYLYLLMIDDLSFRDGLEITSRWLAQHPDSKVLQSAHAVHQARHSRAEALEQPGPDTAAEYAAAQAQLAELLVADPANPAYLEMSMLEAQDNSEVDRLGELLAQVPETHAKDPVFWRYRGWYLSAVGDPEASEQAYRRALELNPLSWQTRSEYASLLRLQQRTREVNAMQRLAADGQQISLAIRHLKHVREVDQDQMRLLAEYAAECSDWQVANGLYRRLPPSNRNTQR